MKIVRRIENLVSANLHDWVDTWEDPEVMLRHALREMEDTLHSSMHTAAKVIANEKRLEHQVAERRAKVEVCQQRAVTALAEDNELEARRWLMRRNEHDDISRSLAEELAVTQSAARQLKQQIQAMQIRLTQARRSMVTLQARRGAADVRRRLTGQLSMTQPASAFMHRFDTLVSRVDAAEAEADALCELYESMPTNDDFKIESDHDLTRELEELKRSIRGEAKDEP